MTNREDRPCSGGVEDNVRNLGAANWEGCDKFSRSLAWWRLSHESEIDFRSWRNHTARDAAKLLSGMRFLLRRADQGLATEIQGVGSGAACMQDPFLACAIVTSAKYWSDSEILFN